jgi:hypothetical protein
VRAVVELLRDVRVLSLQILEQGRESFDLLFRVTCLFQRELFHALVLTHCLVELVLQRFNLELVIRLVTCALFMKHFNLPVARDETEWELFLAAVAHLLVQLRQFAARDGE